MSNYDRQFMGGGLFLIFFPLLATVLPYLGLQHKRLVNMGEYAPLAALVAGVSGVAYLAANVCGMARAVR